MPRKTQFVVGDLAISKAHRVVVEVLSRTAGTMTVAGFPGGKPLPGVLKDKDLVPLKEAEEWARKQPWYTPPTHSLQDGLDQVRDILARVNRRAADARPDKFTTTTPRPSAPVRQDAPVTIRITRTVFLHEVVTPDEEVRRRIPVFKGDRYVVDADINEADGYDWVKVVGGNLLALPPDSWEVL